MAVFGRIVTRAPPGRPLGPLRRDARRFRAPLNAPSHVSPKSTGLGSYFGTPVLLSAANPERAVWVPQTSTHGVSTMQGRQKSVEYFLSYAQSTLSPQ